MDLTMRVKLLPSSCIIKNYVHGEDDCNYDIMKRILKEQYSFEIVSDDPLNIACIDQ